MTTRKSRRDSIAPVVTTFESNIQKNREYGYDFDLLGNKGTHKPVYSQDRVKRLSQMFPGADPNAKKKQQAPTFSRETSLRKLSADALPGKQKRRVTMGGASGVGVGWGSRLSPNAPAALKQQVTMDDVRKAGADMDDSISATEEMTTTSREADEAVIFANSGSGRDTRVPAVIETHPEEDDGDALGDSLNDNSVTSSPFRRSKTTEEANKKSPAPPVFKGRRYSAPMKSPVKEKKNELPGSRRPSISTDKPAEFQKISLRKVAEKWKNHTAITKAQQTMAEGQAEKGRLALPQLKPAKRLSDVNEEDDDNSEDAADKLQDEQIEFQKVALKKVAIQWKKVTAIKLAEKAADKVKESLSAEPQKPPMPTATIRRLPDVKEDSALVVDSDSSSESSWEVPQEEIQEEPRPRAKAIRRKSEEPRPQPKATSARRLSLPDVDEDSITDFIESNASLLVEEPVPTQRLSATRRKFKSDPAGQISKEQLKTLQAKLKSKKAEEKAEGKGLQTEVDPPEPPARKKLPLRRFVSNPEPRLPPGAKKKKKIRPMAPIGEWPSPLPVDTFIDESPFSECELEEDPEIKKLMARIGDLGKRFEQNKKLEAMQVKRVLLTKKQQISKFLVKSNSKRHMLLEDATLDRLEEMKRKRENDKRQVLQQETIKQLRQENKQLRKRSVEYVNACVQLRRDNAQLEADQATTEVYFEQLRDFHGAQNAKCEKALKIDQQFKKALEEHKAEHQTRDQMIQMEKRIVRNYEAMQQKLVKSMELRCDDDELVEEVVQISLGLDD